MLNFKKILVPSDFSEQARLALDTAIIMAKKEARAHIILFHVIPYVRHYEYMEGWSDEYLLKQIKSAKEALTKLQKKIPSSIHSDIKVGEGRITEEILRMCNGEKIDLVITTTHGRKGLDRVVHPNISEEVVRMAPCPVLVLHLGDKAKKLIKQAA